MSEVQKRLITIALRGVTVLPHMSIYLDINRPMSIAAATSAQRSGQPVFLVAQKDAAIENPKQEQLEQYGVVAQVKQIIKGPENIFRVLVIGLQAAQLEEIEEYVPNLISRVAVYYRDEALETDEEDAFKEEARLRVLRELTEKYCNVHAQACRELKDLLQQKMGLDQFSVRVACSLPMTQDDRQTYLSVYPQLDLRCDFLVQWLDHETQVEKFRAEYQGRVKAALDKQQRDYILREQLKLIRKELGEGAESSADCYEEKLKGLQAPEEVKRQLEKEIKRLRSAAYGGPEVSVCQNYIETLLAMPWEKKSQERIDIREARKILEEEHYGLKKVKEQVLEFLSVRKLQIAEAESDSRGEGKRRSGQILCLVGPPGTGKTSIARSIARALNREYVRISLGGVRDEAEIRGHRRTYVAAMPGRIAQAIRKAGVSNPLMLLDELDKMGSDAMHGDVASAMLEVLDGEQNYAFADHYLEVPLDLSDVLFVATANTLETIPQPLLDRMEVIEIGSYTAQEKYQIASRFLLPKQMKAAALPEGLLGVDDLALKQIISGYTREAGVRGLERQLAILCRKAALDYLEQESARIIITEKNIEHYLGKQKYRKEEVLPNGEIGIVRGLAWTSAGGVTLEIEVNIAPGKGTVRLTGKLGDVMKESAQAALSFVRSVAQSYGVSADFFEQHDIHIHIPEGAVPKDGPSAGVTMATAILSAVTKKTVRPDVAMTGEITLRGRVLAIGGLKEKLLAAKAAGVKTVLIPEDNRADLEELEPEVTDGLRILPVRRVEEIIKETFEA